MKYLNNSSELAVSLVIIGAMSAEAAVSGLTKPLLLNNSLLLIVFLRLVISTVLVAPWALRGDGGELRIALPPTRIGLLYLLRASATIAVMLSFLKGVTILPLGIAICLFHTYPILISIVGILSEGRSYSHRLAFQLLICFLGVALIAQPSPNVSLEGVFWVQLAAVLVCVRFLIERHLRVVGQGYGEMIFVNSGLMLVVCFFALLVSGQTSQAVQDTVAIMTGPAAILVISAGLLAVVSQLGVLFAVGRGLWEKFSVLSYWEIVAGVLIGIVFFGDSLGPLQLIGMALIIGSSARSAT